MLGLQYLFGNNNVQKDVDKAKYFFEKSYDLDQNDGLTNYYLGLIHLLGLGSTSIDFDKAYSFIDKSNTIHDDKDSRVLSALGYYYYNYPGKT